MRQNEDLINPSLPLLQGIDYDLKRICEDVITSCTSSITQNLRAFISRTATTIKAPQSLEILQKDATETDKDFRLTVQKELPSAAFRMRLYLEDGDTVSVLLSHVQDNVLDEYNVFRHSVLSSAHADSVDLFSTDELRTVLRSFCEDVMG